MYMYIQLKCAFSLFVFNKSIDDNLTNVKSHYNAPLKKRTLQFTARIPDLREKLVIYLCKLKLEFAFI